MSEGNQEDRERLRAEFEARLGRARVWFIDDPGVAEVLEDARELAILEFVRSAPQPVSPQQLVDAGLVPLGAATSRMVRLERAGFIEYRHDAVASGYACVDSMITIVYDAPRQEHVDAVNRFRTVTHGYNEALQREAGDELEHTQYFDRILRLNHEQMMKLEAAIARIAAEARRTDEASAGRPPEGDDRGPVRLRVSTTNFAHGTRTLAPVYYVAADHPHAETVMNSSIDRLTSRQRQVARLIIAGTSNRDIAERLAITENTVKSTVRDIYRRLDVDTRADLVRVLSR